MKKVCGKHSLEYEMRSGRWRCSECLKEQCRRYNAKNSARRKQWHKSESGRSARLRYEQSSKGKAWRVIDNHKVLARKAVFRAVKSGVLVRPDSCSKCKQNLPTEAHHHNGYEKSCQLDVVWLCRLCHRLAE